MEICDALQSMLNSMLISGSTLLMPANLTSLFLENLQPLARNYDPIGAGTLAHLSYRKLMLQSILAFSCQLGYLQLIILPSVLHPLGVPSIVFNAYGVRFGCVHPCTFLHLFKSLSLLLLYGLDFHSPSAKEESRSLI